MEGNTMHDCQITEESECDYMDRKKQDRKYQTDDLIVYWIPDKCTHACACWRGLPEVFRLGERPWVVMSGASPEEIIETIDKCPSDALKYELPAGS
jgi:uncharacterized Fe-S cluster protein YjdI